MAGYVSYTCLALCAITLHYQLSSSISTFENENASGSLACKTYNMSKLDCSNRNLLKVPMLDQNWTTSLDLSQNQLKNITNASFEKLQFLLILNLSYNKIFEMSSTSFRGLHSLEILDLQENKLVNLPQMIFADLRNLQWLDMSWNLFAEIPGQVMAPLLSLRYLSFLNARGNIREISLDGFEHLTNLNELQVFLEPIKTNISSDSFHPLRKLPLRMFTFGWLWSGEVHSMTISKDAFAPLTSNVTRVQTSFSGLSAIPSLRYPCQSLALTGESGETLLLDKSSLQMLQKWNTSLERLSINLLSLERIEDYAFIWISNLRILRFHNNEINYLANNAFYGLNSLQQLILASNAFIRIPFNAFEVFRKCTSLQYLDLSSNGITKPIDKYSFSAISNSLSYLNLDINYKVNIATTDWISILGNLKHLTLTCSSNVCYIRLTSDRLLPLLQSIQVSDFRTLEFETPLCILFPTLKVARWSSHSDLVLFPLLEAIRGCTDMKELGLSGTLQNTNLVDFIHVNINMSKLEILKLTRNKITSVKLLFFIDAPKLKYLNLGMNHLKTIDSEIADEYPSLIYLNVQDNELTSLSGLEHLAFLQNLNAAANEITVIPPWLLPETHTLNTIDLSINPFQCNCSIEPFRSWILSDKNTWLQPGQYVCATPDNFKGTSITAVELNCTSKAPFILSVTIPSVLLFCVLLIILYRYRWHIKYRLFLFYKDYHRLPNNNNNNEDFELFNLQYHAYVAYNENSAEDDAWVMNELQPNMEEGPEPLKLCIKSRDFTPGHFLLDSIDQSIHQSRKTIIVLSPNFVASEWCYHEMRMVQMRLLDDNLDVVVLVLLDTIPENKMTLSLRQLLCKKQYLRWPKNKVGQRLFWQQLRQEIMGPVQINRCFQL